MSLGYGHHPPAADILPSRYREVYNVSRCSDYPAGGSLAFYDLELHDDNFSLYSNPDWSFINASSGLTPQCGYGAALSPATVTLYY